MGPDAFGIQARGKKTMQRLAFPPEVRAIGHTHSYFSPVWQIKKRLRWIVHILLRVKYTSIYSEQLKRSLKAQLIVLALSNGNVMSQINFLTTALITNVYSHSLLTLDIACIVSVTLSLTDGDCAL